MIVHRIAPHAYPVDNYQRATSYTPPASPDGKYPYEFRVAIGDGYMVTKINSFTAKVVYAQWLSSLGLVRGDYVIHKRTAEGTFALTQYNYLRVVQLQEVHMLVNYTDEGKAKCLELVSPSGTRFWSCPHEWVRSGAPEPAWQFDLPAP